MIIKPRVKGFICVSAHPAGCAASVREQARYAQQHSFAGPARALVIGCSSGYGLASRISLSFGAGTRTIGLSLEREPAAGKTASAGWYNNQAFAKLAEERGLEAYTLNLDAFQPEAKQETIDLIRKHFGQIDLLVYSLAAPRRFVPAEDRTYSSVLKPIGAPFEGKTIDTDRGELKQVVLEPATDEEIAATVKVMGGEDWQDWVEALKQAGVLAPGFKTVAYTYIGDKITWPIYGEATIGRAKKHLDQSRDAIAGALSELGGDARVGVLKALVTQSSAAIPVMPLYISLLYRVMKEQGSHEGCIEQIVRLLRTGLYGSGCIMDDQGRLRVDEFELAAAVQGEVQSRWERVTQDNLLELADFEGYRNDFLKLFGFGFEGVDYDADIDPVTGEVLA